MSKSIKANVNRTDLALNPNPVQPDVDEKLIQSFARLLIWDSSNEIWKLALSDADGRLLVTTSATQASVANQPQINVALVSIQLLAANPSRRLVIIQNLGANPIFVNFGSTALAASGLQIGSGQTFIDDHTNGVINAIALVGSNDVRIVEF